VVLFGGLARLVFRVSLALMRKCVLHFISLLLPIGFCCCLTACKDEPRPASSVGEAFAGPINLNLREDVAPSSKIVATLKHGDRVEILQTRRRFVKVRAGKGIEGWTDTRQLMTPEQMKELQDFSARSALLPSQGSATVFSILNMHAEPNRQSPSFSQIAEGSPVDVLLHRAVSRIAPAAPPPPPPKPAPVSKRKKSEKDRKETALPPPPKGPPPAVPPNWLELSRTRFPVEDEKKQAVAPSKPAEPVVPVVPAHLEDWSLVRSKDGKAGWVLSRMLNMTIPDEVAQYAEGHRITSYFPLGKVQDGDTEKKHWLWTTISGNGLPYEFDSFRVFIWALRRHRYETAYIMRNVKGYYPVEAKAGESPSFSLILENEDGKRYKYNFAFEINRVRFLQKTLWEPALESAKPSVTAAPVPSADPLPGAFQKLKNWFKSAKAAQ
jgi:SH3-like domain-containing protein